MSLKKTVSKSIALSLVGLSLVIPAMNSVSAMEQKEINTVTLEQDTDTSEKAPGFHKQRILQSTTRKNGQSTGYATSTWVKADSYQAGRTYSTSIGYEHLGVNTTIWFTKTISANIPANPAKYSRLKGKADITFKKYKVLHYQGGSLYKTTYEVDKIYHHTYLDVVYKK